MPKQKENHYTGHLTSDFYSACPKAVFAAIAMSMAALNAATDVDGIEGNLLREWYTLHMNGVVPQAPPKKLWGITGIAEPEKS